MGDDTVIGPSSGPSSKKKAAADANASGRPTISRSGTAGTSTHSRMGFFMRDPDQLKLTRPPGTEHFTSIDEILPSKGFVVNGKAHHGGLLAFNTHSLSWKAPKGRATYDSLAFLPFVKPKIEFLILGTGKNSQMPDHQLKSFLDSHDIQIEPMPSDVAVSTFNMMMCDARTVAAAIPIIEKADVRESQQARSRQQSKPIDDVDAFLADIMDISPKRSRSFDQHRAEVDANHRRLHGRDVDEYHARAKANIPARNKARKSPLLTKDWDKDIAPNKLGSGTDK